MKQKTTLLICFGILFFLGACTVQKRTLKKGYFVQWHWSKNKIHTPKLDEHLSFVDTTFHEEQEMIETDNQNYTSKEEDEELDKSTIRSEQIKPIPEFQSEISKFTEIQSTTTEKESKEKTHKKQKTFKKEQNQKMNKLAGFSLMLSAIFLGVTIGLFGLYIFKGGELLAMAITATSIGIGVCLVLALTFFILSFLI